MRTPKNQAEDCIEAMLKSKTITSLTMHGHPYWISNVPDAIRQAKDKGYAIETKLENRGNRRKRNITIAEWSLVDREAALTKYNETK